MAPLLPIWIEKIVGRGEDAQPLLVDAADGSTIVGIFDGLGGAGSGQIEIGNGVIRSEAAIAADLAHEVSSVFFSGRMDNLSLDAIADALQEALRLRFLDESGKLNRVPSKIKSSMSKSLPTTLAIARFFDDGKTSRLQVFWAGDSRVYSIVQSGRLQCLTRDHCKHRSSSTEIDYLAWNGDASMTNCVSPSESFFLDRAEFVNTNSFGIIACSDGLPSAFPDHSEFEIAMLSAFVGATQQDKLVSLITSRRTDDVSAAFINFELEEADKSLISERIDQLADKIIPNKSSIDYTLDILETFSSHFSKKNSAATRDAPSSMKVRNNEPDGVTGSRFLSGISESQKNTLLFALWLSLIATYGFTLLFLSIGLIFSLLPS